MRVFTIRVLFAGLLEASTQAYGFSWRMSTILWSVRFCHHFWNICWIHMLLVVPPSLFYDCFSSGEELHLVWKQQRSGELLTLGHETHQDITTPRHQPTPLSYLFVITLPLLSPLLGKSCRVALLKPILAVPHHGETWRRWTCISISSRQIASGVKLWHFLFE